MIDSAHLGEQEILDWLEGALVEERLAATLAHVDRCDPCRELCAAVMHSTGPAASSGPTPTDAPSGGPVGAGSLLGDRFELLEPLGSGAMGVVWRARDQTVDEDVALKLLPDDRARDAAYLARFRDELVLARAISHPNVCRLHDLVQADGRWFLTMELVEGAPLSVVAGRGLEDTGRVEHLLRQIAAGMAAAHRAGVVHRDLKPSNVVVTRDDRAVVLDFGIARREGDGGRTEAGVLVGTPRYMAPEQGETSKVDARADVYALGLIGCELLSGTVPLDRGELVPTLVARRQEDPPSVRRLSPRAPDRLARILDACLRRDPAHRPADGAAVLALLEGTAELERPSLLTRGRLLVVGLVVVALALGFGRWRGGSGEPAAPIRLGAFEAQEADEGWLAKALPGFVAEELRDGWGVDVRSPSDSQDPTDAALTGVAWKDDDGFGATLHHGDRRGELRADTARGLGLAVATWLTEERPTASLRPTRDDVKKEGCANSTAWRHHRRARRAVALDDYDRAEALAELADCGVDPTEPIARSDGDALARVEQAADLMARGEVDSGVARLEALAREGRERGVALRRLAAFELGYADGWVSRAPAPERGLRHAQQAVDACPHDLGSLGLRALARALAGDHEGADEDAAQALRWSSPPEEAAILALVTSAAMQSRWDDAAAAGRRVLETEGRGLRAEALTLLGGIDLARGAFERGQGRITEAAERFEALEEPDRAAETWLFLSWSHELLGQLPAALDALDRAVAADPEFDEAGRELQLARRGIEARQGGRASSGSLLQWYREHLRSSPADPSELPRLAHLELYAAWQDGDLEAVATLHRQISLGTWVQTWAAFPAAEAAEQAGDLLAAEAHYRSLVDDPYSWEEPILVARARLGLGRLLSQLGRSAEARAELEAFVAAWDQAPPDAPELQQARRLLTGLPTD